MTGNVFPKKTWVIPGLLVFCVLRFALAYVLPDAGAVQRIASVALQVLLLAPGLGTAIGTKAQSDLRAIVLAVLMGGTLALAFRGCIGYAAEPMPFFQILLWTCLPAVCEEVFFRGTLQSRLHQAFGSLGGLFTCAGLFACVHGAWQDLLPLFFLGMMLSLVKGQDGNLAACIAGHAAYNLCMLMPFPVPPGMLVPFVAMWAAGIVYLRPKRRHEAGTGLSGLEAACLILVILISFLLLLRSWEVTA